MNFGAFVKESLPCVRSKTFCVARHAASDLEKPGDEVQKNFLEQRVQTAFREEGAFLQSRIERQALPLHSCSDNSQLPAG